MMASNYSGGRPILSENMYTMIADMSLHHTLDASFSSISLDTHLALPRNGNVLKENNLSTSSKDILLGGIMLARLLAPISLWGTPNVYDLPLLSSKLLHTIVSREKTEAKMNWGYFTSGNEINVNL